MDCFVVVVSWVALLLSQVRERLNKRPLATLRQLHTAARMPTVSYSLTCYVVSTVMPTADGPFTPQVRGAGSSLGVLKAVRLLRVFRTLRLLGKMGGLQQLVTAGRHRETWGSGGSPGPPGPLPMHPHTVYVAYSERQPTLLNPLG